MNLFGTKIKVIAPVSGYLKDITETSDLTFSQKFLGDGVAITPTDGTLIAPVSGTIIQVFHTKHAIGIKYKDMDLLIHIGMDTVELQGEGFETYIKEGDNVNVGDKLITFDLDLIKNKGFETDIAIVVTNSEKFKTFNKNTGNVIAGKDEIFTLKK